MSADKKRILLLLPTKTYRVRDFIDAAYNLGVDVVIGSNQPQTLSETLVINFGDLAEATQKIVSLATKRPIDAIVGVDDDTTMLVATASEALGLPHNSAQSAYATRNKHQMRKILASSGLLSPRFDLFPIHEDPKAAAARVEYPCVLKPLMLSASRGVIRADDTIAFAAAFRRIVAILQSPDIAARYTPEAEQILVEGFIPGVEVALEGMLSQGRLRVLAIFDKPDPLDGPYFEETLYITPSRLSADTQKQVAVCTTNAAVAVGLREGPVHAELRINDDGVWMVEIAGRSIGGLCSRTLRFGAGLSLETLIIQHAIGRSIDHPQRERQPAGVMMIPIPRTGVLREVQGKPEAEDVTEIEEVVMSIPVGQKVVSLPEGTQYLGFIFARARTPECVEEALREAHRLLEFVISAA